MKKLFAVLIAFSFSAAAFANLSSFAQLAKQDEIVAFEKKMANAGFSLAKFEDRYASQGVRPRCPCESYQLTYVKFEVVNGQAAKIERVFGVNTSGFGESVNITISEE